jgi:hypothetical protein
MDCGSTSGDGDARIYAIGSDFFPKVWKYFQQANFHDAVMGDIHTGGFQIKYDQGSA